MPALAFSSWAHARAFEDLARRVGLLAPGTRREEALEDHPAIAAALYVLAILAAAPGRNVGE
jgi:hypothetical protein